MAIPEAPATSLVSRIGQLVGQVSFDQRKTPYTPFTRAERRELNRMPFTDDTKGVARAVAEMRERTDAQAMPIEMVPLLPNSENRALAGQHTAKGSVVAATHQNLLHYTEADIGPFVGRVNQTHFK